MWALISINQHQSNSPLSSVQFSHSVVSNSSLPHELQHARPPCPSPTPGVYSAHAHQVGDAIQPSHPLWRPRLLLPPIPPSIRVFTNETTLRMRWPKYWSFSFSISPSNEHPGVICFRMDRLDLLAVQGTLKVFSNTTVQKDQCFSAQLSSQSNSHIRTWPLDEP